MKGKLNVKTIVILAVVLVVIVLGVIGAKTVQTFMSGATSAVEPTGVTSVSAADGKTATISWTSDKAAIAKVEYGTTAASLVLMATENDSVTTHRVSLTSLRPNTTYYYRIRIGEEVFDNSGIPYTFKTKGEDEAKLTPTISSVPLVSSGTVCKNGVDYNKDGVINAFDLAECKKSGGSVSKAASVNSDCNNNIDYNSDGIVNSLDRINCLQSKN
jgi:hypothetical protein